MSTSDPKNRIEELLQKYVDKAITYEEHLELFGYIKQEEAKEQVLAFMDKYQREMSTDVDDKETDWDTMYAHITQTDHRFRLKKINRWQLAAAAVLLLVGGYALLNISNSNFRSQNKYVYKNDVLPGGEKAILTLADGKQIALNSSSKGNLATQSGISVDKDENGEIVYHIVNAEVDASNSGTLQYNTLTTPAGGTYKVILADGSRVWLNASSTLKYPVAFARDQRKVEVAGEAYFEVEKDKSRPFIVSNNGSEVKVLGTHFNIMSYHNEPQSAVTLLEGSIQFTRNGTSQLVKPGMQVVYEETGEATQVAANLEEVMAWHNSLFVFNNTGIDKIMNDISRWYDVEVIFEGEKPTTAFTGVIPRTAKVSKVLKVLEATGDVKFGIEGKTVTCSKKKK